MMAKKEKGPLSQPAAKLGSKGGTVRARKLSPARKREIAAQGGKARQRRR